jgi:hypothetical protein
VLLKNQEEPIMQSVNSYTIQPYTGYSNVLCGKNKSLSRLQHAISDTLNTTNRAHPIQQLLGDILHAPIALLECLGLSKCLEALNPQPEQQVGQTTPEPQIWELMDQLNQYIQQEQNPAAAKARFEHEMPRLMADLATALQQQRVEIGDMVQFNQTVNAFVDKYSTAAPDTFWTEPFNKLTVKALNYWSTTTGIYLTACRDLFEQEKFQTPPSQLLSLHEYARYLQDMQDHQDLRTSHETLCSWLPKLDALDQIHRKKPPVLTETLCADREVMLRMIEHCGAENINKADPALLEDPAFILEAIHAKPEAIAYIPSTMCSAPEIAMAAMPYNDALAFCSPTLGMDRPFMLDAVKQNGLALRYACDALREDRELVLTAVQQNGQALQYVHPNLLDDQEILLTACLTYPETLGHASLALCADRTFMLQALKKDGLAVAYADIGFLSDRAIVLAAVTQNADALQYASDELRANREIVLEAAKKDGSALRFADPKFALDRGVVLEAVKSNGQAINYVNEIFYQDPEVVQAAVRTYGYALSFAHPILQSDRELALQAVKNNGIAAAYIHETLRTDRDIFLEAAKSNGGVALGYADESLRKNREFVKTAVSQYGPSLQHAHYDLRGDREIVTAAIQQDGRALEYASSMLRDDLDIVLMATANNPYAAQFASPELQPHLLIRLAALP